MKTMTELANKSDLTFDGNNDTRLFYKEMINVHAQIMTEDQYKKMESDLDEV